jgi:hypothetical protein
MNNQQIDVDLMRLSIKSAESQEQYLAMIKSLKVNPGWGLFTRLWGEMLKDIEEDIFAMTGEKDYKYTSDDLNKWKRHYIKSMLTFPERVSKRLAEFDVTNAEDTASLDPWEAHMYNNPVNTKGFMGNVV